MRRRLKQQTSVRSSSEAVGSSHYTHAQRLYLRSHTDPIFCTDVDKHLLLLIDTAWEHLAAIVSSDLDGILICDLQGDTSGHGARYQARQAHAIRRLFSVCVIRRATLM